jgi:outer membrane immunogenic protein
MVNSSIGWRGFLMKRLLYAIIATASLVSGPAMSADLGPAVFAPPPPPILAPAYSWTGCYLGGNGGAAFSTWTYANPTDNPTIPGTRAQISVNDVVAGGQVGCDYQVGEFVLGIQGMFDWSPHLEGRFFDAVTSFFQESAQARWFATATGRIGYTVTPQALVYAKGGAAWVRNHYEDISDFASAPPTPPWLPQHRRYRLQHA